MPLSNYALDKFVGHNISQLTECNAPDLSHIVSSRWLDGFILASIFHRRFEYPERQYIFNFLRRAEAVFFEYNNARNSLVKYIKQDSSNKSPTWHLYFQSILHFEQTIAQSYQALELLQFLLKHITAAGVKIFKRNDGSIYQRLNTIYNTCKHMNKIIQQSNSPESSTIAIWLTNNGLESKDASLSFEELKKLLEDIAKFATELTEVKK